MEAEDREHLAMVLVIGALLGAIFATPIMMGRSVFPQILPFPVITIGFQSSSANDSAGSLGSEVFVAVTGPLGPVPFDRLRVWWDGAETFSKFNASGYYGSTNKSAFLVNVTVDQEDGGRQLMHIFEVRVTVNYTKPSVGAWVPLALLEFPSWKSHTRFIGVDQQSLPYRGFAVELEVKG